MDQTELAFTPATQLAQMIRERRLSPVELVDALLSRMERLNPTINAYCTPVPELAREEARKAEAAVQRGDELGPLHGVPVSIKDLTDTAGIRTTWGSPMFKDNVPTEDALVVSRLKAAGAIVLGKTNTPELGAGINTVNPLFGATRNPWDLSRGAGGSTGGGAASVAAGMGPLAEGSDHGGSLRNPAGFCGIVGFRTSPGRVPQYPSNWVYDPFSVTGPLARTVPDAALMLSVMAGPDDRVPISISEPGEPLARAAQGDVAGLRVAWSPDLGRAVVDPEVLDICRSTLKSWESLGCRVEEDCPDFSGIEEIIPPMRAIRTAAIHQDLISGTTEGVANAYFQNFLAMSSRMGALDVARAEAQRSILWQHVRGFFQRYDLLITPANPTAAFPIEELFPRR